MPRLLQKVCRDPRPANFALCSRRVFEIVYRACRRPFSVQMVEVWLRGISYGVFRGLVYSSPLTRARFRPRAIIRGWTKNGGTCARSCWRPQMASVRRRLRETLLFGRIDCPKWGLAAIGRGGSRIGQD
jgi:hypothetical protein